jgi:hypothetical protein
MPNSGLSGAPENATNPGTLLNEDAQNGRNTLTNESHFALTKEM